MILSDVQTNLNFIISPNEVFDEVFGDIMVLASLPHPPLPPVDLDSVNTRN